MRPLCLSSVSLSLNPERASGPSQVGESVQRAQLIYGPGHEGDVEVVDVLGADLNLRCLGQREQFTVGQPEVSGELVLIPSYIHTFRPAT